MQSGTAILPPNAAAAMAKTSRSAKLPIQQLAILSICRFAEPIALSSVFPYLPEMIESFDVPKNDVSKWAGICAAVFSLSQATTGILWGRASDRFGRKPVILCAMFCIMCTSLLFGFSRSLIWAITARSLAGASNGNVGTMRTTVAEMVPQKELQPRAFSVLPLVWTIGSIFGPAFGGALADPAKKYPSLFGKSRLFQKFPFALPNVVSSVFFLVGLTVGGLFLKETLETKKHQRDYGRALGQLLSQAFTRKKKKRMALDGQQASLLKHSRMSSVSTIANHHETDESPKAKPVAPPTYREVFSYQSNMNLLTYALLALHSIAYDQLLPIFMHYPPQTDRASNASVHLPFKFAGGFGIDSDRIGLLFMLYGIVGMCIQFSIFPPLAKRWGVLNCLKMVSPIFPIVYMITPFTALLPTPASQQVGIFVIMLIKCWAVIFAFPCTTILLTNSATSLRILGTLNGIAVSVSALGRAAGPAIGGSTFTYGVNIGYGILPWWTLATMSALAALPIWWLIEMEGFGGASDNEDDEENDGVEGSEQSFVDEETEGQTSATNLGDEPIARLSRDDEYDDDFAMEESSLLDPQHLSKTLSHRSRGLMSTSLPIRMMSPIGMKDSVGPGGGRRLSNGLGQSNSGFGTGGTSYS